VLGERAHRHPASEAQRPRRKARPALHVCSRRGVRGHAIGTGQTH
jgi:hypothetical protein